MRGPYQEISNSKVNDIHHKVKTNLETDETDVLCLVWVRGNSDIISRKEFCDPAMVILTELWTEAVAGKLSSVRDASKLVQCIDEK